MRFCQSIPTRFLVSFFQNLNSFHFSWHKIWLVRRAVTIFLLKQNAMLGGPFRYLEHGQANWKFSRGLWKKVSAQKMGFCQNIPTRFWASFFQNLNFFHFSWHVIWLVCRTVTIFLPTQWARLSGSPRYLERCRKVHRKFSRGIWKKVSAQNMRFCQNILTRLWASFFKISTFFTFPGI